MKICPQCQNTYTDDSLQFCLQDGAPLSSYNATQQPTAAWGESETVVSPTNRDRMNVNFGAQQSQQGWQQTQQTGGTTFQAESPKSNVLKIVALLLVGLFVLSGIGAVAAWFVINNMQKPVAQNVSQNTSKNENTTLNVNTNSANANVTPSATPTPKPTLKPEETKKIKDDVTGTIDAWKSASEDLDLEGHMDQYADTVDYYKGGKVSRQKVSSDKQKAYEQYDSIDITISNVKVTPDETGDGATAVFDKEWVFDSIDKTSSGKVQQELHFKKINGKWKITGEKDLKVYYVNK